MKYINTIFKKKIAIKFQITFLFLSGDIFDSGSLVSFN